MQFRKSILITVSVLALASGGASSAGQLHAFTSGAAGFNTHSIWYDDGKEVTVVDTQFVPEIAQALVADIRGQTHSPITRVIVTHPNPDKFNALSVFHSEGVESIASVATAAAIPGVDKYKRNFWVKAKVFTDNSYPKIEAVKTTFTGRKKITLKSGETITLFELNQPGISSNQTVVRIDETGDLIVGDLVHTRTHAWLEGGIVDGKPVPNLAGWKADLKEILKLGNGKAYGGRGDFVPVQQAVSQQIDYLEKADAIVDHYLVSLGDKKTELSDPTKRGLHYAAIQAEFIKAFPTYAMPDLIGYSIYGLVQQKIDFK